MPPNDVMALESNFSRWMATRGAGLTGTNPFNYYCAEKFLKLYPVTDKEIATGIVDQPLDGGVDGFFFFANRKYVFDSPLLDPDEEWRINLVIFQCKEGSGFSPVEMGKFVFFTEDLLDLNRAEAQYKSVYHSRLKKLMKTFKDQVSHIAGAIASIHVEYFYITKLDCGIPVTGDPVSVYAERLEKEVNKHFPKATHHIEFADAPKLFAQASFRKPKDKKLTYSSQTIQSEEGWIGLVGLREFYRFLQDEHGDFHEEMLEENVRGFLQQTPVNEGIAKTLREREKSAEFWVLNNGVTILADQLIPSGSFTLTIKDPQIVNGLQTSRNVFDYYKPLNGGVESDKRRVLVRIIESKDEGIRDQIIKATNSQNKMPPEALRATDEIHRKIEEVFGQFGLYYDRRRGYYKDQRKPAAQIVSVRDVLQAILGSGPINFLRLM